MGKFLATAAWTLAVVAGAIVIFTRVFPRPDNLAIGLVLAAALGVVIVAGVGLWRDLGKTYTPPKD